MIGLDMKFKHLFIPIKERWQKVHRKTNRCNRESAEHSIFMFGAFYRRILLEYADIYRIRAPPYSSSFQKFKKWRTERLSDWIKIRIQDFYKDAIGDTEYTNVSPEVYEALINTFRKEAHAELMRDLRNRSAEGYVEGNTEELLMEEREPLEDIVIRQMDLEVLQRAMKTLTEVQKKRLHMYFFEGLSTREIAEKCGVSQHVVWKSIQGAIKNLKRFFI